MMGVPSEVEDSHHVAVEDMAAEGSHLEAGLDSHPAEDLDSRPVEDLDSRPAGNEVAEVLQSPGLEVGSPVVGRILGFRKT